MSDPTNPPTLHGKALRFRFSDGAMSGKSFDHTFHRDGTVSWGPADGEATKSDKAAIEKIGDGCFVASYLGAKGYTLTAAFNLKSGKLVAFASDGKDWSRQDGQAELVDA
jgi:hypothetical protein